MVPCVGPAVVCGLQAVGIHHASHLAVGAHEEEGAGDQEAVRDDLGVLSVATLGSPM